MNECMNGWVGLYGGFLMGLVKKKGEYIVLPSLLVLLLLFFKHFPI